MAHPLHGSRAKIGRAEKHLEEFHAQRRSWIDSSPYAIMPRHNDDKTRWTFRLYPAHGKSHAASEAFGLIVGDYVHALRSALDHLAWALVTVANKRTPSKEDARKISFPVISTHPKDFWGTVTVGHLKLEQALMLEGFQPYRAVGMEETTPLAHLHALWNLDKHRLITPIKITLSKEESPVFSVRDARIIGEPEWDTEVALVDGTDIAWVTVGELGDDPQVDMDRFSVDVTFGESDRPIQNLPELGRLVAEIVQACETFFKRSNQNEVCSLLKQTRQQPIARKAWWISWRRS